jgi:hypothetical protein
MLRCLCSADLALGRSWDACSHVGVKSSLQHLHHLTGLQERTDGPIAARSQVVCSGAPLIQKSLAFYTQPRPRSYASDRDRDRLGNALYPDTALA